MEKMINIVMWPKLSRGLSLRAHVSPDSSGHRGHSGLYLFSPENKELIWPLQPFLSSWQVGDRELSGESVWPVCIPTYTASYNCHRREGALSGRKGAFVPTVSAVPVCSFELGYLKRMHRMIKMVRHIYTNI